MWDVRDYSDARRDVTGGIIFANKKETYWPGHLLVEGGVTRTIVA
jgi:hypothetical protein